METKEIDAKQENNLQDILNDRFEIKIENTDITIPTLQIIQKVSQNATPANEGQIIVKDFNNETADEVKVVILGYKKYYFVWTSQGDEVLAVVPLTADLLANKLEFKNGKYVYADDPTANIIFTYVYEIIVIINGKQTLAKLYLRKSGLSTAKKINSLMVQFKSRVFDLTTIEKSKGNLKWYVFDVKNSSLTSDEFKNIDTILNMYNLPEEKNEEPLKEVSHENNYEELPF